ncbi:hypothetical protein EPA93_05765 [Ktedonosporobacter rubrisoli]|uniref:PepSY domain-containing protein n=1 Tax=Ktedonosporobacter rubrisoli TaxID=2509675 RepID=A0A4P6JLJ7_KTERU|nr:PepSY-associated TM helix domain-containing protein [Ktedonosporobacter rubrisoli]QBD75536.1 hypothetical protein EPA93_05765 [Ktedonosporobacter rubrisoli]
MKTRKQLLKVRTFLSTIHLWLGLILALFLLIESLTGAILVFRNDIDHLLYPQLFSGHPGTLSYDAIKSTTLNAYPGYKIGYVRKQIQDNVYQVGISGEEELIVYIDAGTHSILGTMRTEESFTGLLTYIHDGVIINQLSISLTGHLVPELSNYIIGILALTLLALCLTGIYIWWPSFKKWILGFTIRWKRRSWYIRHYDLHKVVGVWTLPFLLMFSITALNFAFPKQIATIWYAITFSQPLAEPALVSAVPSKAARPLDSQTLKARAVAVTPGGVLTYMYIPADKQEIAIFGFSVPYDPRQGSAYDGQAFVYLDQYSGKVLMNSDPRAMTWSQTIYWDWFFPLHAGSFAGLPGRILTSIAGLAPAFLAVTGIFIWYLKRAPHWKRRRSQLAKRKESSSQKTFYWPANQKAAEKSLLTSQED